MTLTDFLLARYAEAEVQAEDYLLMGQAGVPRSFIDAVGERLQKECAAKRQIVELHARLPGDITTWDKVMAIGPELTDYECSGSVNTYGRPDDCRTLRALASVYADHPDYNPAWS
jgi:hypothetical protein